MKNKHLTLFELQQLVKKQLDDFFVETFWLVAEISQVQISQAGHCYMELIEKKDEQIIAKTRANVWAHTFRMLKPYFETTTGLIFQAGLKILVKVSVRYDAVHGYSLDIKDIEPGYTRGEIEVLRRKIYQRLEAEGISGMNKELEIPRIPKIIAVISSPKAAGYEDFINQLENNAYGYRFSYKLFAASMQGKKTENTIIAALEKILEYENVFDIVVVLRGGGSSTDIGSFDSYNLAAHCAQFPLPIISAIGHDRDETVLDLIANKSLKTPTAAADFFIQRFLKNEDELSEMEQHFTHLVLTQIMHAKQRIKTLSFSFVPAVRELLYENNKKFVLLQPKLSQVLKNIKVSKNQQLAMFFYFLNNSVQKFFLKKNTQIQNFEKVATYSDPHKILDQGYSIAKCNGKIVKDGSQLKTGAIIETQFYKNKRSSKVL